MDRTPVDCKQACVDCHGMPNRLASEKSPYLRQHADNPVDWQPWGPEAFARAEAEQKPIFLSVGYSTCHWCHVMAHESFENPAVAEILNRDFVPVKLDREERPDIDRIYMTYVQHTTGHGGWPMSVWLTPDRRPFYGGTYFPPEDRGGRPGFITLLTAIARHWREQREKILEGATEVVAALQRLAAGEPVEAGAGLEPLLGAAGEAMTQCVQYFYEAHDAEWGGFGGAPKFPRPSVFEFLLRLAARQGLESDLGRELVQMATFTLRRMAEGGIHDHVGGGFHRYSVDAQWFVPHFEKMLYDQAQLAASFLQARQATQRETYAWIARGIFDYVARDLTHPGGGFYSAEDADSVPADAAGEHGAPAHAVEGAFYVWPKTEIDALLGDRAALVNLHFGVKTAGNVASDPSGEFVGKNILRQVQSLAVTATALKLEIEPASAQLVAALETLRVARDRRPRPSRDEKIITAWNGLMISAFARGRQVLGSGAAASLGRATRAAEFLRRELWDEATGALYRSWLDGRGAAPAFAEDYACLIQGLIDLYEAGFEIRWLQWAVQLQAGMDALFWDAARGGYFNSRADDPSVLVRLKEDHDGAEPAANSVAAVNLLRLDWMIGGPAGAPDFYRERARAIFEALRSPWTKTPHSLPLLLSAVELLADPPRTVVLAGRPDQPDFEALAGVLHEKIGPRRALLCADGGEGQAWLAERRPYLAEMKMREGRATAFVCQDFTCGEPAVTPDALRNSL